MADKRMSKADTELNAIAIILKALNGLDGESIQRVIDYVFSRLSIGTPTRALPTLSMSPSASIGSTEPAQVARQPSIRDLKDDKQPESSNQMAALVAYYLSEVAGEKERKETLGTSDVEKYFKQAGFKLPKSISQTLPNAAAAGYFDPVGSGQYRLNPVGYNLVAHGLPRSHGTDNAKAGATRKKKRKTR